MKVLLAAILLFTIPAFSQTADHAKATTSTTIISKGIKDVQYSFIENIGQYGSAMPGYAQMGKIEYGFEGFGQPVLFTSKGIIHLQQKIKKPLKDKEEAEQKKEYSRQIITMEWLGANPNVQIIPVEVTHDYHTYGLIKGRARGFKKIIYKNLYPGIDVIYRFSDNGKSGYEYDIYVKPGADPGLVKMKYGGDVKNITTDKHGNLVLSSALYRITETAPIGFTIAGNEANLFSGSSQNKNQVGASFLRQGNTLSFRTGLYDKSKPLIIDPFVSSTANLTGTNNGIAKDVDFDYDGNIYVAGGGDIALCQLAKFDANGVLQWTFNGISPTPPWTFGGLYGGWVVEKTTGNIYLGQGAQLVFGSRVIRLNTAGVYDNYITTADPAFQENWKMIWNCNGGTPEILILGGSITSNLNFAICTPPSATLNSSNITGISTFTQDIADIAIDPLTNGMYTVLASAIFTPTVNNRIYKNPPPYNSSNISWSTLTGFTSLFEGKNRPYLTFTPGSFNDNSVNALAVNGSYLFYWDGQNLKAFKKSDGSAAGTALTIPGNAVLQQGGIVADECNNIFIGDKNGTIKVYHFDGSNFDDAAAADITIPGFPNANVYDLACDQGRHLLYASGKGFVGSFDISAYCAVTTYTLNIATNCPSLSVQASLSPAPPASTQITYSLFSGSTQIANNNTGLFTGLSAGINYTVKAFLDQACGGIQLIKDFNFNSCTTGITASITDATCNANNGIIDATANYGTAPYQFSLDGIVFQSSGLFTGLAAGNYTITTKDALNSIRTINVTINNFPPPGLNATATAANCNLSDGSITASATGGTAPLLYSIDGINFQSSNIFTGLAEGNYTVIVKDAKGCEARLPVTVALNNTLSLDAGNDLTICKGANITLQAVSNGTSFAWSPATGLNDPFVLNPVASPDTTTRYTLSAVNGTCTGSGIVTVFVRPAPAVFAGRDTNIAINQPLQLNPVDINHTGFNNYSWSPSFGLNDPFIQNPVAVLNRDITYRLTASIQNAAGCSATDDISIKVFEGPAIYVPGAFTPNEDSKNDILKAIPIGLKQFIFFRIYNRYGEQVFATTDPAVGWNGYFKNKKQAAGTYTWIAEGVDYRGNKLQEKGTVILLR